MTVCLSSFLPTEMVLMSCLFYSLTPTSEYKQLKNILVCISKEQNTLEWKIWPKCFKRNYITLGKALWNERVDFTHLLQCFFTALLPFQPKSSYSSINRKSFWIKNDTGSLKTQVGFPWRRWKHLMGHNRMKMSC